MADDFRRPIAHLSLQGEGFAANGSPGKSSREKQSNMKERTHLHSANPPHSAIKHAQTGLDVHLLTERFALFLANEGFSRAPCSGPPGIPNNRSVDSTPMRPVV